MGDGDTSLPLRHAAAMLDSELAVMIWLVEFGRGRGCSDLDISIHKRFDRL